MKKILLFSLVAGLIACTDSAQQSDATSGDERAERSAELREADERDGRGDQDAFEDRRRPRQSTDESAEVDETGAELTHDRSGCAPAGCSGQICAEAGADIMPTCEFRPEYACYQQTACERQPSGECGWTETEELRECIRSAGSQRAVLE